MKRQFNQFLAVFLLIGLSTIYATSGDIQIDKSAPNFTLVDSNGKTHSLNDYKGKTVVLEWTNFRCPFCVRHYGSSDMQNLQKKYTSKGVVWLTINSSGPGKPGYYSPKIINEKIKERNGMMTAYLIDDDGVVGKMYEAKSTPQAFIINPEGILVYAGAVDNIASTDQADVKNEINYVANALDLVLRGKEVAVKTSKLYGCQVFYKDDIDN